MAINVLTEETLPAELEMWQQFLRLQDWKITVEIVEPEAFESPLNLGECNYWVENRSAIIKIVSAAAGDLISDDFPHEPYYDMAKTFLHEVLHVFFAPLEADLDSVFLEQKVRHLADRLINGKWWVRSLVNVENDLNNLSEEENNS